MNVLPIDIPLLYTFNLQEENLSEEEILQLIETLLESNKSLLNQGSRFRMNLTKIGSSILNMEDKELRGLPLKAPPLPQLLPPEEQQLGLQLPQQLQQKKYLS